MDVRTVAAHAGRCCREYYYNSVTNESKWEVPLSSS